MLNEEGGIDLFVPGRVGLIGELSDLVAPYLEVNQELFPGRAIACTLNSGIYSYVCKSDQLVYRFEDVTFSSALNFLDLEKEIANAGFLSYICGTVLYILKNYPVTGGIDITIKKMDLPIKKGLSSSAAICLTVALAYNSLYHLGLENEELSLIAYEGEHFAGSQCGKLDQYSIMNGNCSSLTFLDGSVKIETVSVAKNVCFLIVDLNSNKNTRAIMNRFNRALPFFNHDNDHYLYDILGKKNYDLVNLAQKSLETGDLVLFGSCLKEAQRNLDRAMCTCHEFRAPKLHLLLNDGIVDMMTYGGKSIGSGGDGTLLLVCESEQSRSYLVHYIQDVYQMNCIEFNLQKAV